MTYKTTTVWGQTPTEWERIYVNVTKITGYSRREVLSMPVSRFLVLLDLVKSEGKKWIKQGL